MRRQTATVLETAVLTITPRPSMLDIIIILGEVVRRGAYAPPEQLESDLSSSLPFGEEMEPEEGIEPSRVIAE